MNEWLVDTNVLLDVLGADPVHGERSRDLLERCAEQGVVVINPVVFAEVAAFIPALEDLDRLLPGEVFRRDPIPWEAAYLAGRALSRYRQTGVSRERVLADFLIGAHAAVAGFGLLTRDRGYARHFDLEILNPSSN